MYGKRFYSKGSPVEAAAMAIWGMVHGLVSLQIRDRFEKLDGDSKNIKGMMHASLNG